MLNSAGRTRMAFTLIELLVVVAIIVVLIAVLMPALSQSRNQAKNIICRANLQQIMTAVVVYTNENNGSYFDTPYTKHIKMSVGFISGPGANGTIPGDYTDWGLLYECGQLIGGKVGYCPRDVDRIYARDCNIDLANRSQYTKTSYFTRNYFNQSLDPTGVGIAITKVTGTGYGSTPLTTLVRNEESPRRSFISDLAYVSDSANPATWINAGYWHDKGYNVAYTDGSVSFVLFGGSQRPTEITSYVPWGGQECRIFPDVFDKRQ